MCLLFIITLDLLFQVSDKVWLQNFYFQVEIAMLKLNLNFVYNLVYIYHMKAVILLKRFFEEGLKFLWTCVGVVVNVNNCAREGLWKILACENHPHPIAPHK